MTDTKINPAWQRIKFTEAEIRSWSIDHLDLRTRGYNTLRREGVDSIGKLVDMGVDELFDMRGMGAMSVSNIVLQLKGLKQYGADLKLSGWRDELEEAPWFVNA